MGSNARVKLDVDELGVYGYGDGDDGTDIGESWICPSMTDCLRAWGWLDDKGRVSERDRGEGTFGEEGADEYCELLEYEQ